jgi:glycosyltransferase involved in cell wall biosynthesis
MQERKNILFICNSSPNDTFSGMQQRTALIYKTLSEYSNLDIFVIKEAQKRSVENKNNHLMTITKAFIKYLIMIFFHKIPYIKNIVLNRQLLKKINETDYDYIFFRYLRWYIRSGLPLNKKIIIDFDDLPSREYTFKFEMMKETQIYKNNFLAFFINIYYKQLILTADIHTKFVAHKIGHAFFSNKNHTSDIPNSSWLPNIPFYTSNLSRKYKNKSIGSQVLFVGSLLHSPNAIGLNRFLKNIWPFVVSNNNDVILNIVGFNTGKEINIKWEENQHTKVLGFLENIQCVYDLADVVVVPIYHGAGTNIKILEAISMKVPCVISSFSSNGFENILVDGKNIFIAENDNDFIKKLNILLNDKLLREQFSNNAYRDIISVFSFENIKYLI